MLSLDQKVYYICCALLVLLCVLSYRSAQTSNNGWADLIALVTIIIISLTLVVSFILSHLILKRWYTLSIPASFILVQLFLSSWARSQASKRVKKQG